MATGGLGAMSAALRAGTAIKTITASIRAQGALRTGTLGLAEGAGERIIHSASDPLVTGDDIVLGAVLGSTIGGGLGALFPRAVGGVFRDLAFDLPEKYTDEVVQAARATRGLAREGDDSAGAMRVPGTDDVIAPGKGASGFGIIHVINKLPGLRNLEMERWLRNPKRVLVDIGIKGKAQFEKLGLTGNRHYYDRMNRLLRVGIANEAEVAGTGVRPPSVQDLRLFYQDTMHAVEQASQKAYIAMTREVFGTKHLENIQAHIVNSQALGGLVNKATKRIKAADFERMADEFSNIKAHRFDDKDYIPDDIKSTLSTEQVEKLRAWVEKQAKIDDEYYAMMGKLEVDTGVIKAEELIPGYRPQVWNKDAITSNREGFKDFLRKVFKDQPEESWLKKNFRPLDDAGKPVDFDNIEDLQKIDEKLAAEAKEDWDIALREEAIDKKAVIDIARNKELKKFKADSLDEIEARYKKETEKTRQTLATKEQRFADATDPQVIDRLAKEIGKLEKKLADGDKKLAVVRALDAQSKQADEFIRKFGSGTRRKGLKALAKSANASARALARAEASDIIDKQLDQVVDNILNNRVINTSGPAHQFATNSSRFLHRNIDLGKLRHTDQARSFLDNNSGVTRRVYDQQSTPQIALRQIFGDLGEEGATDYETALRKQMTEGYEDDLKKLTQGTKEHTQVLKDQTRATNFFNNVMKQLTGSEGPTSDFGRVAAQAAGIGTSGTATMLLGGVSISQLSDLAVMALAGGTAGAGFRSLNKMVTRELRKMDDTQMAVVLQGANTIEQGRFKALYDLDDDIFVAGGRMARIRRVVDEVGVVEGFANLMHVWNRKVRGSFGVDFARQMDTHFHDFDNLSPDLKRFYAKHGIDRTDAIEIADMLSKHHEKVVNGLIRIPKTDVWSKQRPDLYMKYRIALRSAGDEALLDPGLADRPFMRASALGRIILQFSSFMFTASEKFIPVLAQEARLNLRQSQVMFSIFMTATMAPMVSGIQAYRYGKFDEWASKWDSPEGRRDNLWEALIRSPLMASHSGTLMEFFSTFAAGTVNDGIESGTGMRPLKEDSTRFKQMQGIWGQFGALPGTLNSAVQSTQDLDKFQDFLSKRAPIYNVFYLQMLTNAMKDK
jgi:hypothetical protein